MDVQRFGAFVAQRRRELGMTQSELAAKLFVTDKAVSKWERGLGFPDINTLEPLAAALDVSLMELMNSQRDGGELSREQADGAVSEALGLARGRRMPLKKQLGLVIALCALALAFSLMLATANSVILTLLFLGGVVAGIGSAAMLVKGAGEAAGMYRVMLGASLCCVLLVTPGTDRFFERWSLWIDLALDVFIVAVMAKGMRLMLAERHRHSRRSVITLVLVYLFLIAANVQGALGSMAEIDAGGEAARANVAAQYAELLAERDFGLPPGTAEAVSCGRAGDGYAVTVDAGGRTAHYDVAVDSELNVEVK